MTDRARMGAMMFLKRGALLSSMVRKNDAPSVSESDMWHGAGTPSPPSSGGEGARCSKWRFRLPRHAFPQSAADTRASRGRAAEALS
jgi:hypothetical protein